MSSETREQILADFMECTGLENEEECITILEQYQWNLLNAVQAVHDRLGSGNDTPIESTVPKHSTTTTTTTTSHRSTTTKSSSVVKKPNHISSNHKRCSDSDDNDADDISFVKILPGGPRTNKGTSGTINQGAVRELRFKIEYKDQTERITIFDNESIRQLKLKIAEKLHVSLNRQQFTNWISKHYDDQTILKDLNLPKDNTIHLIATATPMTNGTTRTSSSSTTTTTTASTSTRTNRHPATPPKNASTTASSYFPITVLYEDKSDKRTSYELVLKPTTTVGEMKKEIEHVAHLPIRQQNWTGLFGAKDTDQLCQTSIRCKAHLIVRKTESSTNQKIPINKTDNSTLMKHASEDETMDVDHVIDLENFDDDINSLPRLSSTTTVNNSTSNRELLIPDRCTDDITGLEHFSRVFHARFGSTGPILYIGSLDQAIQDSLFTSRNERRPLAIYIHNDRSVCANVFCAQVLASEATVEYLANNYVVWAWDITTDANRTRLLETFKRCIGPQYAQRISAMEKDAFPLLLILIRSRGSLELISIIEGKSTPSEALLNLIQSHDLYEQQRQRDAEEEISREKRENLKKQQEDEYNRSLQADLAKEQARLADERRQKEEHDANERLKLQKLQQQQECKARLPAEPSETEKDITRLKIRLPNDEGILMRRFRIKDTLQILFDYLTSQGRIFGDYKLLSTYPKRDLTQLNRLDTFEQLKLYPQEQLILENL
ncbi:unnamed protein product [Rotaria sp. Silwood1]|nr:unnamed protein product [Rotaria sp. Silwood1]CAF0837414.1 unnamed protein product [Rotaria sp. Silwood1]CAF3367293.1 unnamed protein product [Rotaria sp. Silwood1]CAF3369173.1 unnamed protein product [Rotaria sp. Silwood1]CAF3400124.1 unnamed protein product [Rotaria sp. Silwood1]